MADDFIEYRLPETVLVLKGTRVERTDHAIAEAEGSRRTTIRTQSDVRLEIEADQAPTATLTARIEHGSIKDTSVTFELTEDRRLVSASSDVEGQAGKVLLGIIGASAGVAGLATGFLPVSAGAASMLAAVAARDIMRLPHGVEEKEEGGVAEETDEVLDQQITTAAERRHELDVAKLFLAEMPEAARLRQRLSNRVEALLLDLATALWRVDQADADAESGKRAMARVRMCQNALAGARAEHAHLEAVYEAWRASKVTESGKQHFSLRVPLHKVLDAVAEHPPESDSEVENTIQALRALGLWLKVVDQEPREQPGSSASQVGVESRCMKAGDGRIEPSRWAAGVLLRKPRRLSLALYQRYDGDDPTSYEEEDGPLPPLLEESTFRLVESTRCFIVDGHCRHEFVPFRKSWWGRRTTSLDLWPDGGLRKYSSTSTSQAAAMTGAVADIPSTIDSALESAASVRAQIDAVESRPLDLEIAKLKRLVDLKNQQLTLVGLNATAAQTMELERLRHRLAILQAQADIDKLTAQGS